MNQSIRCCRAGCLTRGPTHIVNYKCIKSWANCTKKTHTHTKNILLFLEIVVSSVGMSYVNARKKYILIQKVSVYKSETKGCLLLFVPIFELIST